MNKQKKTSRIYGFGSVALDFRIKVADLGVGYKDKLLARKTAIMGGGSVANCLIQISRLGMSTFWLGKLGDDWISNKIIEQFKDENVDSSFAINDPKFCSPFNLAVYAGDKSRRVGGYLIPNSLLELSDEDIVAFASHINEDDWVIVEIGEIPLDSTLKFCEQAKKNKANLAIDVDLDPVIQCIGSDEIINDIFSISDILIPNYKAMQTLYSNKLTTYTLVEKLKNTFEVPTIITAGSDGVYYAKPGESPVHQKAYDVYVVDTVGAGDAFHGGLLYGLACNMSLSEAVKLGSRCGAINCQSFGARAGMPWARDLDI